MQTLHAQLQLTPMFIETWFQKHICTLYNFYILVTIVWLKKLSSFCTQLKNAVFNCTINNSSNIIGNLRRLELAAVSGFGENTKMVHRPSKWALCWSWSLGQEEPTIGTLYITYIIQLLMVSVAKGITKGLKKLV